MDEGNLVIDTGEGEEEIEIESPDHKPEVSGVSILKRKLGYKKERAIIAAYYQQRSETIQKITRWNETLDPPLTISLLPVSAATSSSILSAPYTKETQNKSVQTESEGYPIPDCDGITKTPVSVLERGEGPVRGRRNIYTCDVCGRTYAWRTSAVRHRRVEHEGIMYPCKYCGLNYSTQHALTRHLTKVWGRCRTEHYQQVMLKAGMGLPEPYHQVTDFS